MLSLMAVIQKELLLLLRDRAGLLVLFVMPAVLVVVVTLVQENALKTMGAVDTRILLINQDTGALGRQMVEALEAAEGVRVTRQVKGRAPSRVEALALVADGVYQLCLIIPSGMTERVRARARSSAQASLSEKKGTEPEATEPMPCIEVHFDPTVMGSFRSAVGHLLDLMVLRLEVAEKIKALGELLPEVIHRSLAETLAPMGEPVPALPALDLQLRWSEMPLLQVEDGDARAVQPSRLPTSAQQNVPAWTLFGIFFIVLPMSGAFIQERINGTRLRLLTMPVGYGALVGGRIIAYAGVCSLQCLLIGGIGKWLLPLWGAPGLTMGGSAVALLVITACAILAATGYGILLGTVIDTYQQAAMIGPISVVIAAALGGIMVPVYAMPPLMQKVSVVSPLGWGLNGILDVFVRRAGLAAVLPEAGALAAFFCACILMAWRWERRQG
ncbi:ABC transporter permease [Desulfosarcina ovata]|uniref:ABC transporter n=1 Tax=Desulfosarcina ovata subsp. ovata TaxID=2752305 RepID=A0A5K8AE49_9BACT|nr:ABC transporter permease [Desulfosarcina ovata]BBO90829.1 ABC transporter [Desulfosarcina ovata subsp. ovata]